MAKIKYTIIKITLTFQKIMILISGLWLFILSILNSFPNININTKLFVYNNNGDNSIIILITAFLFICITIFIHNKISKLIIGGIFIIIAIIGIIGTIITSTKEISTWIIIVGELIGIIGSLIWLLEGTGVISYNKKNVIINKKTNNK